MRQKILKEDMGGKVNEYGENLKEKMYNKDVGKKL